MLSDEQESLRQKGKDGLTEIPQENGRTDGRTDTKMFYTVPR